MAEEKPSPISAPKPPAVNPLGGATATHASTLKLKPVIRKPTLGGQGAPRPGLKLPTPAAPKPPVASASPAPDVPAPESAVDKLKGVTQKLKGVTQQIPQQAILHKTGIIADQNLMDEAQKQAAKSRTARISLSDALGVAPVQNEAAPMKTIRIKRPSDIAAAAAPAASASAAPAPADAGETTVTQRKTLKIARPGATRPGAPKLSLSKKPAAAPEEGAATPPEGEIADIPEMPAVPAAAFPPPAMSADGVPDVPSGLLVFDFILQFAACCAVGFLGWLLYTDLNTAWF